MPSLPRPSTSATLRATVVLLALLLVAHAPMLLNDGLFMDDWLVLKPRPDFMIDIDFLLSGAGHPIFFSYDTCYSWSSTSAACPAPGYFEPDGHSYVMVQTDASGVAIAPPYIAGPGAGFTSVYAYPPPGLAPYYFSYSPSLNNIVGFRGLQQLQDTGSICEFIFRSGFE